jgi:hypothetical protein
MATTMQAAQQDRRAVAVPAEPRVLQAQVAMAWVTRHCMATMLQVVRLARPTAVAALAPAETEWAAPTARANVALVAARWLGQAERAAVVTRWAASRDATRQVPVAGVRAAECPAQAAKTTR